VIMLIFVLRKHLCTNCYYYGKWCHSGWGKLASLMFKKNSGSWKFGIKLARFTWAVLMILPIIGMIVVIITSKAYLEKELSLLTIFLILGSYQFSLHIRDCSKCKMRAACLAVR
jgi:hypothetical protein